MENNKWFIKYNGNELSLAPGHCLQPDNCTCDNFSAVKCFYDLNTAKQKVIKAYATRVHELCNMSDEQFLKEYLLEN